MEQNGRINLIIHWWNKSIKHLCPHCEIYVILNILLSNFIILDIIISFPSHLFQVIRGDVVRVRVGGGLLQAGQAPLQGSNEALPQVVHRTDQLVGHGLVQTDHYQLLDLVDAGFDFLRCDRFTVGCYYDVCKFRKQRSLRWKSWRC